jgi:hypothetical protein
MNEIRKVTFDSKEYTDENFLYENKMIEAPNISSTITHKHGKDNAMFPLTYMTEGQGLFTSTKPKKLNDSQYVWDVMERIKFTSRVVKLDNASITKPGFNFQPFEVVMEDNWIPKDYGVTSPDGQHQCRIDGEPEKLATGGYKYTFVLKGTDAAEYVTLGNFIEGQAWSMSAPTAPLSKSDGNRTNRMTPGKLTNQFGLHRYSMEIAGNIANKITVYEFEMEGGGKTNLWMPEEMRQFEITRRVLNEEKLWYSKYNRDEYGHITTIDKVTGEPVPEGAGIKQIITEAGNHTTYTSLSRNFFDNIINRIFSNRIDGGTDNIMMYAGQGFMREFHRAILSDAQGKSYYEKLGLEEIRKLRGDMYLEYGSYFQAYRDYEGRILTVVHNKLFDHGPRAQADRANGRLIDQYPLESYNAVFLDHGTNENGERNIIIVQEDGREFISGVYKGMSKIPEMWQAAANGNYLGTRRDIAAYEIMETKGINMLNDSMAFWLEKSWTSA